MEDKMNIGSPVSVPDVKEKPQIMREFPQENNTKKGFKVPMFVWIIIIVLAGVGTGWALSGGSSQGEFMGVPVSQNDSLGGKIEDEAGVLEKGVEYEDVEGMLIEGGIDGEGTHYLERTGGASQNVYLTSSTLDLQSYVGKKVHIWGITISGQKAGWLMEVGKIKLLD